MGERSVRHRAVLRAHRCLVRWGLVEHPWGREYAKEHIGLLGGRR